MDIVLPLGNVTTRPYLMCYINFLLFFMRHRSIVKQYAHTALILFDFYKILMLFLNYEHRIPISNETSLQ